MVRCAPKQPRSEKKTDAQAKNGSAKQQHLRNFLAIPNSNRLHLLLPSCERLGLAAAAFPSPEERINFVMIAPLRIASGITRVGRRGEKPKKKSVEGRGKCGIAEVLEHVSDLRGSNAGKGEWWKPVFGKKLGAGGFMAVLSRATLEFAEEKELVSVESVGRVPVKVTVVERCKLADANVVAGFFPGLARGGDAGRLTHIGPAARERPATVFDLADEENAAIVKNCGANVDFGSGIA